MSAEIEEPLRSPATCGSHPNNPDKGPEGFWMEQASRAHAERTALVWQRR